MSSANREGNSFYEAKQRENLLDKIAISLLSNCLLSEGDSIIIDAGTSLTPIAKIIKERAQEKPKQTHYSIMTHNRSAFDLLIEAKSTARFNVFHTGGRYDEDLNASFGWLSEYAYQNFHAKWAFMGQAGLVSNEGLFCHGNTEELSLKRIIFSKPGYARVIIADWSKIGIPAGLCFGDSDKFVDNVDYCLLLTTMPNKQMEISEKLDRELTRLESTYKVKVIRVDYDYKDNILSLKDLNNINNALEPISKLTILEAKVNVELVKGGTYVLSEVIINTKR